MTQGCKVLNFSHRVHELSDDGKQTVCGMVTASDEPPWEVDAAPNCWYCERARTQRYDTNQQKWVDK